MTHPSSFTWVKNFLWAAFIWMVACFMLLVIADKVILPIIAGQLKSKVIVPPIEGLSPESAKMALESVELEHAWRENGKYSSLIEDGAVLTQMPSAGREVKSGRKIYLTKSLGKRQVSLPELRGKSKRQGQVTMQRLGVVEGAIQNGYHASIPRGVIIRTIPQEGSLVRVGDTVSLVISNGRQDGLFLLPRVEGEVLPEAKKYLEKIGFKLGVIQERVSEQHTANTVLSQYPKHGEYLAAGTEILLTVAASQVKPVSQPSDPQSTDSQSPSKEP